MKRINYRHYVSIAITLGFLALSVFVFSGSLGRIIESLRDIGLSLVYYFCKVFNIEYSIEPTVNTAAQIPFFDFQTNKSNSTPIISDTFEGFQSQWVLYWQTFISVENISAYFSFIGQGFIVLLQILIIAVPVILLVIMLFRRYLKNENNDYNKDSKPLKNFKKLATKTYYPLKKWIKDFINFIKSHKIYVKIWLFIWLWNFNIITIIIEFFAFYFYFSVSVDFSIIYMQIYKLFVDLSVPLFFIPLWMWVIVALIIIDRVRKKIAYGRLNHLEMKNRGFINERPIVTMACGTMGKNKTACITDMALSQEVIFRNKAFEMILLNDIKFPFFPWINFENELKHAMNSHAVYNLATCERFVYSKYKKFLKRPSKCRIFGYDFNRYEINFNDELKVVNIWEVLEIYAKLYFIYVIQSSLLISNYSVRVDNILSDLGNFPLWNTDFFKRDSRLMHAYSRHAHIIDFDALRLGRKIVEDNAKKDMFEFGVVLITEIGKERLNGLELQGVKRDDKETNQKNDGFNEWLKMVRHSATVDNFPFVKIFVDEQRPSSWGADARDLCEIIHIREKNSTRLLMPLFALGELLHYFVFGRFKNFYYEYRYNRGDNTLFMHILKTISAKISHYYTRIYNRFSCFSLFVQVENGVMDNQYEDRHYYLMPKKIYSKRYSTDCFGEFFTNKAMRSEYGLDDMPEYKTERATFFEMGEQNSYFMNGLIDDNKAA